MTAVYLQVHDDIERQANQVLSNMGLSIHDAVQLFLMKIATEKTLPFSQKIDKTQHSSADYRLGALPNIKVPDNFDDIEVMDFDE
ncbi:MULTISPECIES: type II toxin-antitoxin system RelB/DinJ family antitoxin [unclassified Moraxella]|uniref:type II toxin-antitoxin system RelB/DinJ family antitoxin n=1 Tax=unclassified Moraxella TaxID=2685852 RepID=UPI003AF8AFF4